MIAVAHPDPAQDDSLPEPTFAVPLPVPEELAGHGLINCLEMFAPMIQSARSRVCEGARALMRRYPGAPFSAAAAEEALALNLAEPLLIMMTRTVVLELNVARLEGFLSGITPEARFLNFLDRLRTPAMAGQIFDEYPVLVQQVAARLEQWIVVSLEFLERLCSDWDLLREKFCNADPGSLVSVRAGAGDTHRNGRSVMIAGFSGGERLVYKPRSLAVDQHFQELLSWFNDQGADPRFRLLQVVDRGAYGWAEFIATESCETPGEIHRFYQRQGAYIAILYALEASDFHCENLIAHGEHPMLIDLEASFHPRIHENPSNRADVIAGSALGYSALRTGLLPQRYWANEESAGVDMSGLGSVAGQLSPQAVPQWDDVDTDQMRAVRRRTEMPGANNRPALNGSAANAFDYAEAVAGGFASMYRMLLEHRDALPSLLNQFADDEVRVILRPTHTYAALLHESYHPDVLRDESDREALFNRLRAASEGSPSLERAIGMELADLRRGDVPLFTSSPASRHVWSSSGERLDDFYEEPGGALVERRLQRLSEDDLQRQLWIVRASVATLGSHTEASSAARQPMTGAAAKFTAGKCIAAARAIGDRLGELALSGDDDAAWLGLIPIDERDWQVAPLGPDLYDGLPGVILFLAQLSDLTAVPRYASLARSALKTLRRQVRESLSPKAIGGFTGRGGLVYCLTHLGVLWSDASLLAEAEELAGSIPEAAARDTKFDVISGSAGCALSLSSLMYWRPSDRARRAMLACGERLLEGSREMDSGIGWICPELGPEPLTGFAHGNAGIAHALFEISGWTGLARFRKAAQEAMNYERALYCFEHRNWPDLRPRRTAEFVTAWCHGAPGIALARLSSLPYLEDRGMRAEIDVALETTLAAGFGVSHTLCHGDLGNIDVLLYAAQSLHSPRWLERAQQMAARVLEEASETGWVCGNPGGVESPGLMTGLAGIGYGLLRLAEPEQIPCVLALAPPISQ